MQTKRLLFFLILLPCVSVAQKATYNGFPSAIWSKLYHIRYEQPTDGAGEFAKPVFTDEVKKLEGKTISLPGYIVPFENTIKSAHFMLSSLPLNACFFCGVGGPETAVEVFLREPVTYTEKPVEVQGTLRLNSTDPERLYYILENARLLGEIGL